MSNKGKEFKWKALKMDESTVSLKSERKKKSRSRKNVKTAI